MCNHRIGSSSIALTISHIGLDCVVVELVAGGAVGAGGSHPRLGEDLRHGTHT